MNRISKASVRGFRRPRAGEQGDESPPPAPPTLSSVPEFARPISLKRTLKTGHHRSVETPSQDGTTNASTNEFRLHRPFPWGRGPRLQGQSEVARGLRYASGAPG